MLRLIGTLFSGIPLIDKLKNAATLFILLLLVMGIARLILSSIQTSAQNELLQEQKQAYQEEYTKLLTSASASLAQYFTLRAQLSNEQNKSKQVIMDVYNKDKDNKAWGDTVVPSGFVQLL